MSTIFEDDSKRKDKHIEDNIDDIDSVDSIKVTSSPVSDKVKTQRFGKQLILIGGVLFISYLVFHGISNKKPNAEENQNSVVPSTTSATAPKLTLTGPQIEKLKSVMSDLKKGPTAEEEQEAKIMKMREVAPVQVYASDGGGVNAGGISHDQQGSGNGVLGGGEGDGNTQFMNRVGVSKSPLEKATRIIHPDTTLAQGAIIWATLESRIVSDLPGMVRAITSEDVYSEDSSQILLPRGSRLIGQYTNGLAQGQRRVFVVWQRLIRPDHIDIQLSSPGTDPLGSAGLSADGIDHHFIQQFGTAMLLSVIGAGASNVGVNASDQFNSASAYRAAIADSFGQTAQKSLNATGVIKPTIYINQGNKISVFVARDLDFYDQLNSASSN